MTTRRIIAFRVSPPEDAERPRSVQASNSEDAGPYRKAAGGAETRIVAADRRPDAVPRTARRLGAGKLGVGGGGPRTMGIESSGAKEGAELGGVDKGYAPAR